MTTRPDRPVRSVTALVRAVVRGVRLFTWKIRLRGRLQVGQNVAIGANAVLLPPTTARLGENIRIGRNFFLQTNVIIGSDVLISSDVAIVSDDHRTDDPFRTVFDSGRLPESEVEIEGDNLIGYGVRIIGPVRIGRGCVVGAGAVVTRDLPPNTVCAGVPARVIRSRFKDGSGVGQKQGPLTDAAPGSDREES